MIQNLREGVLELIRGSWIVVWSAPYVVDIRLVYSVATHVMSNQTLPAVAIQS